MLKPPEIIYHSWAENPLNTYIISPPGILRRAQQFK
jgi:hypothetical protein